jgi:hypothetical protein
MFGFQKEFGFPDFAHECSSPAWTLYVRPKFSSRIWIGCLLLQSKVECGML